MNLRTGAVIAAAAVTLAGCASANAGPAAITSAVSAANVPSVGTVTFVYDPVSGCLDHEPYVYLTRPQTGITYLINGIPANRLGQLITAPGNYQITAIGDGVAPSAAGPWEMTVPESC